MSDIISKLYYGEIRPCEKTLPNTKRYNENREKICSTEEKLLELFPECKKLLDAYTDALCIDAQLECEQDFVSGFRLGAMIAARLLQIMINYIEPILSQGYRLFPCANMHLLR